METMKEPENPSLVVVIIGSTLGEGQNIPDLTISVGARIFIYVLVTQIRYFLKGE